jgi:hypothetical protein
METLTKQKIIEILWHKGSIHENAFDIFSLHKAEIAKWRELNEKLRRYISLLEDELDTDEYLLSDFSKIESEITDIEKELNLKSE